MRIEFASNSDKINFALNLHNSNEDIDYYKNNTEFIYNEFYNGKYILIIEFKDNNVKSVYLSVFNIQNNHINKEKKLSNFIFKYEVSENNEFSKLKPEKDEISFTYKRTALSISFPKIEGLSAQSKIHYIAQLIPGGNIIENENIYTISLIESEPSKIYTKSEDNFNDDRKLELIEVYTDKVYYLVINCEILENNNEEKFAFKYVYNPTNLEPNNGLRESLIASIIAIIILAVIAIIFVIVYLILKNINLKKSIKLKELNKKLNQNNVLDEGN